MAEVLLFHHAQGLTHGCLSFADRLRAARHVVHAPDLYDGKVFTDLTDGVRYAGEVGFDTIIERGRLAADSLPDGIVYAGRGRAGRRRGAKRRRRRARCAPSA
jgi:dienelactone hydrolase